MKRMTSVAALLLWVSAGIAQEIPAGPGVLPPAAAEPALPDLTAVTPTGSGFLTGNRNFRNFIGFMSNPVQSIDPRAVTQVWPIFGEMRVSAGDAIPRGAIQTYGAGLNVALSERLSLGLNDGGYAATQFTLNNDPNFILRNAMYFLSPADRQVALDILKQKIPQDPALAAAALAGIRAKLATLKSKLDALPASQDRQGWLNLGGFVQYTVYQNVATQALVTAGLRWTVPCGSPDIFQGRGPAYLAPYVTVGKEFGKYHILATTGYEFAAERTDNGSEYLYANVHLDRQTFGWLYPLVEVNSTHYTTTSNLSIPTSRGVVDFGSFTSTGNLVTMAAGANVVLITNKLEIGGVYSFPLFADRNLNFDGFLVKAVYRY